MDSFFSAVLGAGHPSLGRKPRPGTLTAAAVRQAVATHVRPSAGSPAPDRLRLLEGIALLWHDHWNEAHEIAQAREGERDFDLLHAILHRQEGDFANAGYWFRKAGKHPSYPMLERRLAALSGNGPGADPAGAPHWSPTDFIARVQAAAQGRGEPAGNLAGIQAEEFRAFAEWLLAY